MSSIRKKIWEIKNSRLEEGEEILYPIFLNLTTYIDNLDASHHSTFYLHENDIVMEHIHDKYLWVNLNLIDKVITIYPTKSTDYVLSLIKNIATNYIGINNVIDINWWHWKRTCLELVPL